MKLVDLPIATNGQIAILNHEGVLERCWHVIQEQPDRRGSLEQLVDEENKRIQFLGDAEALDRLSFLSKELIIGKPKTPEAYIAAAQSSSALHLFDDSRQFLRIADDLGGDAQLIDRISLSIDQATWEGLDKVLDKRYENAAQSKDLSDLVPLGALQAEVGLFQEANVTYINALKAYKDLSPFPLAWTCFQLGKLWGEQIQTPDLEIAAEWYRRAIEYLPPYVHARVHLSEILMEWNQLDQAIEVLEPIAAIGDPEINWRKGQILEKQNRQDESRLCFSEADSLYRDLINRHKAAFADHGVEFYMDSGANYMLAYELALFNFDCRQTLRSFNLLCEAGNLAFNGNFKYQEILDKLKIKWQLFPNFDAYDYETDSEE
jgi:hypothetical protein